MRALTTSILIIATLATFATGCTSSRSTGWPSMSESDRVYCARGGGTWRAALNVCEPPANDR
jgi:hypothetical protein